MAATFFGLPPFFPFARAASAFATVLALPPFLPSATACGFLLIADVPDGVEPQIVVPAGRGHVKRATDPREQLALCFSQPREIVGAGTMRLTARQRATFADLLCRQIFRRVLTSAPAAFCCHAQTINPSGSVVNGAAALWQHPVAAVLGRAA